MPDQPGVDPKGATLADASRAAGEAAQTLSGSAPRQGVRPSLVGQHFAHFRIDSVLGRGGMGEVYLATDMALDRRVALKLLPREVGVDNVARERFVREARSQARLIHPNVCHIYFIGEQDGQLFFAMEYVEGQSLQLKLDLKDKLDAVDAIEYCRMAALGLREAQRHGYTHRDIKPSNLLVDGNGVVKLVDFGIVKEQKGSSAETGQDVVLGTPYYMSPEQARGDPVDFRSDIYALGVTLHHLVTGSPPFTGPTPLSVVSKHLSEPRPHLPGRQAALDAVLERMMAKRARDRFQSYDEVIEALDRLSPRRTRPAGFWVRTFAVALDLIICGLAQVPLQTAWKALRLGPSPEWMAFILPIYFIAFLARGRTPGMRALEIQLEGRPPGLSRSALRWLVSWGPVYLVWGALTLLPDGPAEIIALCVLGAWLLVMAFLLWRDPARRALWDRAAKTRVVYRRAA